jgi:PAS domain S-box-containing protein
MKNAAASEVEEGTAASGLEAMLDLSLDLLGIATVDGHFVRVNKAFERTLGYTAEEFCSRSFYDFIHPDDQERTHQAMEVLGRGEELHQFENRYLCRDGSIRWLQWNSRPGPVEGFVAAAARDVTESRSRKQQSALRRVAMLVARGVSPSEVFSAVAEEMVRCVSANAAVHRLEGDTLHIVAVAGFDPGASSTPVIGESFPVFGSDDDNIAAMVLRTGKAARVDSHQNAAGPIAARLRKLGLDSVVAAPIIVEGGVWGFASVGAPERLPSDTEERLGDFAELVATAIANAAARDELIASRARIVAAADHARRRIERDLHDGAQQRLVSLGLQLRLAESSVPPELQSLKEELSGVVSGLTAVSSDLQEISRGIHPAILSDGGLGPALKTLARRCPIPAKVDVLVEGRLPDSVEVAAYYVAAEALTNAAKYADASQVTVCAETKNANLCLSIQDDGIGGADSCKGSGLIGLKDRVEVLGGHMKVISPPGSGTALHVTIPLNG